MRIPYARPSITDLEVGYALEAASSGWGPHSSDFIDRFESMLADHLQVRFAVATSSCTGALHMGLAALGVGQGDEVILAETNWVATVAPIIHLGARPVFVDVSEENWCIDPNEVLAAITPATKAIVATHLYGNLADIESLLRIGEDHGIPVVEDAAEAIGSRIGARSAGTFGKFGTFSFHGSKTVTTGEGGALVTSDADFFEKVVTLSNHGRIRNAERQFWPDVIGFKYKMSNLQAAIGCGQMERIHELVSKKQWILSRYRELLRSSPLLALNPEVEGTSNGAWMPTVVFSLNSGFLAAPALKDLRDQGIDARPFFWPLSSLPMFVPTKRDLMATSLSRRGLNLPSFHDMTDDDIGNVVGGLERYLGSTPRA